MSGANIVKQQDPENPQDDWTSINNSVADPVEESAGNDNVNRLEQQQNVEPRQPPPVAEPFVPQDLQVETPKVT